MFLVPWASSSRVIFAVNVPESKETIWEPCSPIVGTFLTITCMCVEKKIGFDLIFSLRDFFREPSYLTSRDVHDYRESGEVTSHFTLCLVPVISRFHILQGFENKGWWLISVSDSEYALALLIFVSRHFVAFKHWKRILQEPAGLCPH